MPIPKLVGNPIPYWLPPGVHRCTFEEVERRFLFNETRQRVWERFLAILKRLRDCEVSFSEMYVDGSFVTARKEPGDVDGFVYVPEERMMEILNTNPNFETIRPILMAEPIVRRLFGADLFFVGSTAEVKRKMETFTRGVGGHGLRKPTPGRDPSELTVPNERGILLVDCRDFFQAS
jgi:hypothetical protein